MSNIGREKAEYVRLSREYSDLMRESPLAKALQAANLEPGCASSPATPDSTRRARRRRSRGQV
jgi:hypothetical protein